MKTPKMYYSIMAVFWVITLGIGMVNAMGPAQSPAPALYENGQAHPGCDLTNATIQQEMINRFEQQGTDVSGLKAAFASGNMTDAKTWLDANRPARPDGTERPARSGMFERSGHPAIDFANATIQQEMISRFEQQGTDVSGLKVAFASGDMTAVKTWLDANRPAHPCGRQHSVQAETAASS